MDYGEVLSRAWKIIWRFKILWIFGILASCSSNYSSSVPSGSNSGVRYSVPAGNLPPGITGFFERLIIDVQHISAWIWILIFIGFLALIVIAVVLGTIGRIGLIRGVSQADEGAVKLPFDTLFTESFRYFWRIFLLYLLVGILIFVVVILLFLLLIVAGIATLGLALLCLVPLACLLVPAGWVVSIILELSTNAIVVEDQGIIAGLSRGWDVIRQHIGPVIVIALILGIGGAIAAIIIALPIAFILIPPIMTLIFTPSSFGTGLLVSIVIFLVYLPIWLVLAGVLRSYISASWTLTFRRLTGKNATVPV
jgi:hypothetical protein